MSGTGTHGNYGNNPNNNTSPIITESGSEQKTFQLKRQVFPNKTAFDQLNSDFKKLGKSNTPLNEERIQEIYDEVFYDITIDGKNSHKNVVHQSYNH